MSKIYIITNSIPSIIRLDINNALSIHPLTHKFEL